MLSRKTKPPIRLADERFDRLQVKGRLRLMLITLEADQACG
jgi:hypothetical protein